LHLLLYHVPPFAFAFAAAGFSAFATAFAAFSATFATCLCAYCGYQAKLLYGIRWRQHRILRNVFLFS
jgi:hypothetical protein